MMKKMRERTFSGSRSSAVSEREVAHMDIAREAAEEGIVLLKNDGILPLPSGFRLGLFGGGAVHTIKGGTGSGDVCVRRDISVREGMERAGFELTDHEWLEECEQLYQQSREDWKAGILKICGDAQSESFFDTYVSHPFQMPAGPAVSKEDVQDTDTAVYVISRIAGEGADRHDCRGDYYLSAEESDALKKLGELCSNIIVLLNTGGVMDVSELLSDSHIRAILNISQPGMSGGDAVASVLVGKVSPCGKLAATWPRRYEDLPNADTFSYKNGDLTKEKYEDGIYVGYRYFDSFDKKPAFPFGFGLSYTSFEIVAEKTEICGDHVRLTAAVKNAGDQFSGKEVVQLYAVCPQDGLKKERKRLAAFAKTRCLAPGEEQRVELCFDAKALASFSEKDACWILEKGIYILLIGSSSETAEVSALLNVEKDTVIEKVSHICPLREKLDEIVRPDEPAQSYYRSCLKQAEEKSVCMLKYAPEEGCGSRQEVQEKTEEEKQAETLAAQMTDEELAAMVVGEVSRGHDVIFGSAGIMVPGAAGETCGQFKEKYGIAPVACADGPAGLRVRSEYEADLEHNNVYAQKFVAAVENGFFQARETHEGAAVFYQYCTAFPVGTCLAQSWNTELIRKVGHAVGVEMQELGISWWLAPGMNIQRNPLCGRNFEYFSEDPLVSGICAAAMTDGVQSVPGVGTTIKHFACNNLEDNRVHNDSIVSERALREIYLRGFEIAVRNAQPMSIMTSYNLINGVHSANNYDLCTVSAREEWGFRGFIMTDWSTTDKNRGSISWKCAAAGNDLIMPGSPADVPNILEAVGNGSLSRDTLRACVARILAVSLNTLAYE